jgi:hypothetical protein
MYGLLEPHLPRPGRAIELGCGVGHGVLWLLEQGFEVFANDAEPEALAHLKARIPAGLPIHYLPGNFMDLELPRADVIVAGFCLFFLGQKDFDVFWPRIVGALGNDGVFAGQFLGIHDDWVDRGYTAHDRQGVEALLKGFDILYFEEAERDGETALGTAKHWHIFHVVARRGAEAANLPPCHLMSVEFGADRLRRDKPVSRLRPSSTVCTEPVST